MRRLALLVLVLAAATRASAADGRWLLRSDLLGGANPPGLMAVGAALRQGQAAGVPLQGGLSVGVSPAYGQGSLLGEVTPFPFFVLDARADLYRYLGENDALLSFPSAGAPFGTAQRNALTDAGQDETGYGRRFMLEPTLRAQVGRLIAANQTDVARYSFSGRGPYFLELEYDTLLRRWDTLLANRTFLLYALKDDASGQSLIGPYFDFQHAFGSRLERARLGADLSVLRAKAWRGADAKLYLLPGFDLRDPNRRHQLYFAGGVGLEFGR